MFRIKYLVIGLFLVSGIVSCKDVLSESINDQIDVNQVKEYEKNISEDIETIYYKQRNLEVILNSFVFYSPSQNRYILDLSIDEGTELGISQDRIRTKRMELSRLNNLGLPHIEGQ